MLSNAMNSKSTQLAAVLLISVAFIGIISGQSREPIGVQTPGNNRAVPGDSKKVEDRIKRAQSIIENVLIDSRTIVSPVVRTRIRIIAGDAYWNFQPEQAREILSEEFSKIALIAPPDKDSELGKTWSPKSGEKPATYKGIPLEQVKEQVRREAIAIIGAHDPALARMLVAAENEKVKTDRNDLKEIDHDEVLEAAGELAVSDPEAAATLIRESTKNGVSDMLAFLLIRLRETSPADASALFEQAFSMVRMKGDLWDFERLIPYVLPTELDRLIGGKQYLADPARMKDAKAMVEYAAELLYRRIQTQPPTNMNPDLVKREYYIWRNLLSLFMDLKPEAVWLVNTRLRQLTILLPPSAQRPAQSQWSEERLNQLIADADASSGDKRDQYLGSAASNAWQLGQGDFDKAILLAEKIGNDQMKDLTVGTIYFQAGLKYLPTEGPDRALGLARKIKMPGFRVRLYLAVIRNLSSVKASERADTLRDELLNWLRNCDKNSDTAWAVLDYLDAPTGDAAERIITAFDILVPILNSPNLEPPHSKLKGRVYWYPDFHDFRRSLAALAKTDFDKGLEAIQMLNNREIALLVQAAFCADYLKLQSQRKLKPLSKPGLD